MEPKAAGSRDHRKAHAVLQSGEWIKDWIGVTNSIIGPMRGALV
jgi:hypothetical protein